jgi:hypothetical protein
VAAVPEAVAPGHRLAAALHPLGASDYACHCISVSYCFNSGSPRRPRSRSPRD